MDQQNGKSVMDQLIFQIKLPVETISVYLLCCSLVDTGQTISIANLRTLWSKSEKSLSAGIEELTRRKILSRILSDLQGQTIYRLLDAGKWRVGVEKP